MNQNTNRDYYLNVLLILLSVFIQQSTVILNVNTSFSDIIVILLCIYLYKRYRQCEHTHLKYVWIFFTVLLTYRIIITLIFVIFNHELNIGLKEICGSIFKISMVFIYFLAGYHLTLYRKQAVVFMKSYIVSSLVIASLCIIGMITHAPLLLEFCFYDIVRARGLMNDPNYFALTQIVTLILIFKFVKPFGLKMAAAIITIGAIFTSGSKTSLVILVILIGYYAIFLLLKIAKQSYKHLLITLGLIMLMIISTVKIIISNFEVIERIPSAARMLSVFSEGTASINVGGSNRILVWQNGIDIIRYTYGFGIGLLEYTHVGQQINNVGFVAHNTLIQIVAEWGAVFTIIFIYLLIQRLYQLLKVRKIQDNYNYLIIISGVIVIYSMTVSLNNSRYVALIIGLIFGIGKYISQKRSEVCE